MTRRCLILLTTLAFVGPLSAQEVDIEVIGLFKGRAMLEINGEQILLSEGQRSDEGVLLLSANSREATIEVGGERLTLDLSSRIAASYAAAEEAQVSIALNDRDQYRTTGSINGRPTSFVVDTGANIVAMNAGHARQLGIDYQDGRQSKAMTAGGPVRSWDVSLAEVEVGGIRVNNVRAAILEGQFPQQILLGMTFLRNVEMRESSGVLVLTSKM